MLICDAHCDTLSRLFNNYKTDRLDITLERLKEGKISLQTMAMYVGGSNKPEDVKRQMDGMLTVYQDLLKDGWVQAFDPSEAEENKVKTMLSIEGCEIFEQDFAYIQLYRDAGVRMAAITWNYENALGTPHCKDATTGLTDFGFKCLFEMERLGIAADVSHLNERGFWDIMNKGHKPPLASHSCARKICDHTRNLNDGQLKALFQNGGWIGLNYLPLFLTGSNDATTEDIARHIRHMYDLGGAGHVGLGSDFDGIGEKPVGLDNPTELPNLFETLKNHGFSQADLNDIAGKAFIDYYKRL